VGHTLLDPLQSLSYFVDSAHPNAPGLIIGAGAGLVLGYSRGRHFVERLSYAP